MRKELLYKPDLLFERLSLSFHNRKKLARLSGTPAQKLSLPYLDNQELIEATKDSQPVIIYDIGAYKGTWALLAKSLLPDSTIHAFEPISSHVEEAKKYISGVKGIDFHNIGLGNRSASLKINCASSSDASSILEFSQDLETEHNISQAGEEMIQVEALDDYVLAEKLPVPDLIKLDVQGYELKVLEGAVQCLEHAQWIIAEVSFKALYTDQALFHDVSGFLYEHGYGIHALSRSTPLGIPCAQTDVLFRKNELS